MVVPQPWTLAVVGSSPALPTIKFYISAYMIIYCVLMSSEKKLSEELESLRVENRILAENLARADLKIEELQRELDALHNVEKRLMLKKIEAYEKVLKFIE